MRSFPRNDEEIDPRVQLSHPNAAGYRDRIPLSKGLQVYPWCHSASQAYRDFLHEVYYQCESNFPIDSIDGYGGPNGRLKDFDVFKTLPGFYQKFTHCPPFDVTKFMIDEGIKSFKPDKDFEDLTDEYLSLEFSRIEPTDLVVRKGSSSMSPFFRNDKKYRVGVLWHSLQNWKNKWYPKFKQGKYKELFFDDKISNLVCLGRRSQSEGGKPRKVADEEYAFSSGAKGKIIEVGKEVYINDKFIEGFYSQRNRNVFAPNFAMNAPSLVPIRAIQKSFTERYPETFLARSKKELEKRLSKRKFHYTMDVSNHDFFYHRENFEFLFSKYSRWLTDEIIDWFRLLCYAPYYAPSRIEGEPGGYFAGNSLMDPVSMNAGMYSGVGPNGKVPPDWNNLVRLHLVHRFLKHFKGGSGLKGRIEEFLLGFLEIGGFFKNDNGLIDTNMPYFKEFCDDVIEKEGSLSPYQMLKLDEFKELTGYILCKRYEGDPNIFLLNDIRRFFVRRFNEVEFDVNTVQRWYTWQEGFDALLNDNSPYYDHPLFDRMLTIVAKAHRAKFGCDLFDEIRKGIRINRPMFLANNATEAAILEKSDKLFYHPDFEPSELIAKGLTTKEFIEQFATIIPVASFERYWNDYFK